MRNVTLADIAKKTGYSVNTVSHALNDKPDISEKTKKYISQVASEMGYIANTGAGALRSGKSKSVAIIVGDVSNPHFSIMIKEMETALQKKGYNAFIINTAEDETMEKSAIISAISKNVDGILICPVQKSTANIEFLEKAEVPFVLFGRRFRQLDTNYVICDDVNGGYLAGEFLLRSGHRDILFLNAPQYISSAQERYEGIQKAFAACGKGACSLTYAETSVSDIHKGLPQILQKAAHCTAIICFSDLIAMEVCYLLKQRGKAVPEDISVVGFDNIASKFYFPLMISSVTSSKTKMSEEAVKALFKIIDGKSIEKCKKVLPTKIVERESTKKRTP